MVKVNLACLFIFFQTSSVISQCEPNEPGWVECVDSSRTLENWSQDCYLLPKWRRQFYVNRIGNYFCHVGWERTMKNELLNDDIQYLILEFDPGLHQEIPTAVVKLKNLRFLRTTLNGIAAISIDNLCKSKKVEALDLNRVDVVRIPRQITKLKELKIFRCHEVNDLNSIGNLNNLPSLSHLQFGIAKEDTFSLKQIEDLHFLVSLSIQSHNLVADFETIKNFQNLRNLGINMDLTSEDNQVLLQSLHLLEFISVGYEYLPKDLDFLAPFTHLKCISVDNVPKSERSILEEKLLTIVPDVEFRSN